MIKAFLSNQHAMSMRCISQSKLCIIILLILIVVSYKILLTTRSSSTIQIQHLNASPTERERDDNGRTKVTTARSVTTEAHPQPSKHTLHPPRMTNSSTSNNSYKATNNDVKATTYTSDHINIQGVNKEDSESYFPVFEDKLRQNTTTIRPTTTVSDVPLLDNATFTVEEWSESQVKPCDTEKTIFIYIYSARDNWIRRSRMRTTIGAVKRYCGVTIRSVFFVGAPSNASEKLELIDDLGDIVIDPSYTDTYRNLTAKGLSALSWANQYCSKAIAYVKIDDDSLLDPYQLVEMVLSDPVERRKKLACRMTYNAPVIRNKNSKWYLSKKEYANKIFPAYCQGFGYIWPSNGVITNILQESKTTGRVAMEDAYFTGILAEKIGLKHYNLNDSSTRYLSITAEQMANNTGLWLLMGHQHTEALYSMFWNLVTKRQKKCRPK